MVDIMYQRRKIIVLARQIGSSQFQSKNETKKTLDLG